MPSLFTSEHVHFPNCSKRFLLFGNREKKRFAGEASYSSVSGRSSHSPPPPPPRSSRSHRIMEMRLAPILILYYFPAEFSRHLYDNAKKIFPSPQKNPSGNAASSHYSPASAFHHARVAPKPSTPPSLSLHCLSSRIRVVGIARRSRFSSSPSPSIFFAAPPITETDDTVAPPLPAAPSIFASAFGYPDIFIDARSLAYSPSHISLFINHAGFTKIANLRAKRRKIENLRVARATQGERERERLFCSSEEFITIPRFLSMDICLLLSTLLPQEFDKPRFVITRYRFSVSGLRDLRTRSCEKSDEKFCPAVRRRRDFFPRETIPPAIIRPIGVALILCAIKRFINRADKFGNNRGRGRCLRVTSMRGRSISGNRVDRLLAVKGDGARRIGSCSAATPVGTQRQR